MIASSVEFYVDGHWLACRPTKDLGSLGERYLCELTQTPGQQPKQLLLRLKEWPQMQQPSTAAPAQLLPKLIEENEGLTLRAIRGKLYRRAAATPGATAKAVTCTVLQQDVTGLRPLRDAILQAQQQQDARQIWKLFDAACVALRRFGAAIDTGSAVPLQCPTSLAVDAANVIVVLDAEVRIAGGTVSPPMARQLYETWFGELGSSGLADVASASLLHSQALLRFFRNVLSGSEQSGGPTPAMARVIVGLGQVPAGLPLAELEDWIHANREDWSLPLEEDGQADEALPIAAVELVPLTSLRAKKRSLVLLNVVLGMSVIGLLLFLAMEAFGRRGLPGSSPAKVESAVLFSSYCVVFPTQGTIGEKVNATLAEEFAGKVQEIKPSSVARERLLDQKMKEVVAGLPETEKLKLVLDHLAADHAIRFKGYASGGSTEGLSALIERGGIFTIAGGKEQHGSLLQADSLDMIVGKTDGLDVREVRQMLASLRTAVADYASLKDALTIIGDRPAFLIAVEPTAAGHEATRQKLLGRLDKPVFSSRPIPGLFDAVDPTSDSGGGSAAYALKLERPCFWRVAGKEDRQDVDLAGNDSNNRLLWASFAEGEAITWKPVPLKKRNGKTQPTVSFDVAVRLGSRVVVFRNQNILLGETKAAILKQAMDYLDQGLKLRVDDVEEGVKVGQQGQQVTGALNYSYLAELVKVSGGDVEVYARKEFEQRMKQENDQVVGR